LGVVGKRRNRTGTRKQGVFIEHSWSLVNTRKAAFLGVVGRGRVLRGSGDLYFWYIANAVEGGFIATVKCRPTRGRLLRCGETQVKKGGLR
jgi:hypothetical protein